jgi:cell wall-associated NlpC family hydrolase
LPHTAHGHTTRNGAVKRMLLTAPLVLAIAIASQGIVATPAHAVTATEIANARKDLDAKEAAADKANETLEDTQVKLDDVNSQIQKLDASVAGDVTSLRQQVRGSYKKQSTTTAISSILDARTFDDLVKAIGMTTEVSEQNIDAVQSVADDKATLKRKRDELQKLADEQKSQKADLDAKAKEATDYLNGLNSDLKKQLGIGSTDLIPDSISSGTNEAWRDAVLMVAYANLGGSYVWGGSAFKACDCSGLVLQCYKAVGVSLAHSSESQAAYCKRPISQAVPGDICYRPGHVGIYIGNGRTIEAHSPSRGISYGTLSSFVRCGSPI